MRVFFRIVKFNRKDYNMKKIILLICILIGVSSCDMIAEDIQESKIYFANFKSNQ